MLFFTVFALALVTVTNALPSKFAPPPLPGCQTFNDNQCQGDIITTNASMAARRWFTPAKGDKGYMPSFQSYASLVGYTWLEYSPDMQSATLNVNATHKDPTATFKYIFGTETSATPSMKFDVSTTTSLSVSVVASDGARVDLETVDFVWNRGALKGRANLDLRGGQKGAIVEMFGWPDSDIEEECAFLGKAGYLGVKIFPHQEQVMSYQPYNQMMNPWYFMYQPVSYKLEGRMGTRDDLRKMIKSCRAQGVRVYADAVVNHMTGGGNDVNPYHRRDGGGGNCDTWPNKTSSLGWRQPDQGSSPFYTQDNVYTYGERTGLPPSQEFPAASYGPLDFHCERVLNSWNDPLDLNAGWLTGLTDLNTENDNVQERIAAYLTDLISIGISGFRIDAAKHMKPDDIVAIFSKFKRNMGGTLPSDFITWFEVLLGGESDMLMCNADSGYNYGGYLVKALQKAGFNNSDVDKIKIWNSGYPKEPEKGLVDCSSDANKIRSVIQNDDADQQNPGSSSRDMGDQGCVLIKNCAESDHRAFEEKLFTSPNGSSDNKNDFPIRMLLSSFYWQNGVQGIPDGNSDCSLCTTTCEGCQSFSYAKAFDDSSKGYDSTDYTRVHRDAAIISAMQSWMTP